MIVGAIEELKLFQMCEMLVPDKHLSCDWIGGEIGPVEIGPDEIGPANRTGRNRTLRNRPTF